jgi:hypothetical protein
MQCHRIADLRVSKSPHGHIRYLLSIYLFCLQRSELSEVPVNRDSTLQSKVTSTLNTVPPILNFRLQTIKFWLITSHPAIKPHFRR